MFIHLSHELSLRSEDVIGIFDMDKSTTSSDSRAFLRNAEREKRLKNTARDIPKSFVVSDKGVFLIQSSSEKFLN